MDPRGLSAKLLALVCALALICALVAALPSSAVEGEKAVDEATDSSVVVEETSEATLDKDTHNGDAAPAESDNKDKPEPDPPRDMIYVNHLTWNCFANRRDMGTGCDSRYAFAMTSYMEYLYCRQYGKLVEFSEQYMIDCSRKYPGLNGCKGAQLERTMNFVWRFGMERREDYPYRGSKGECPYAEGTNHTNMGRFKVYHKDGSIISAGRQGLFEQFLERIPILTYTSTDSDFFTEGRHLRLGTGCTETRDHPVLLVGHGRRDGIEFWRVKDSMNPNGYYDVAKRSNCIGGEGYMFGSTRTVSQYIMLNPSNDHSIVAKHNFNGWLEEQKAKDAAGNPIGAHP